MSDVSIFEWVSGVLVPIILGGATLAVATWAGSIAKASNRLTFELNEAKQKEEVRLARVELALAVGRMTGAHFAAQIAGMTRLPADEELQLAERMSRAIGVVGTPEGRQFARFGMVVAVHAPIGANDHEAWFARTTAMKEVTDAWVEDPASGISLAKQRLRDLGLSEELNV